MYASYGELFYFAENILAKFGHYEPRFIAIAVIRGFTLARQKEGRSNGTTMKGLAVYTDARKMAFVGQFPTRRAIK